MALAAWSGLVVGYLELGFLMARYAAKSEAVLGSLELHRHFLWMIPAVHLVIFTAAGVPLALLAARHPGRARRLAIFAFWTLGAFALLRLIPEIYWPASLALSAGLAYRVTRRLRRRPPRLARFVRVSLVGLIGGVAALGAWTYDRVSLAEPRALAALPPAAPGAPNVLLIVLDTVRADRLSVYGYGRPTTPNLQRLASRGVVFDQARAAAPWTLPSHATIFTGRWPHELNVATDRPLDGTHPTLAEFLAGRGYATAGFIGNTYFCNSWFGLARGFAHYEDYYDQNVLISPADALHCTGLGRWLIRIVGTAYNVRPGSASFAMDAERINRDCLRWIDAHPGRPFFAFLNYMDVHDPYLTPPGFDRHFGLRPESPAEFEMIRSWHAHDKSKVSPRDVALIGDAYDDCLASLDEYLGRLLGDLQRRGVLEKTLVIVTSDHGEQLGEHGLFEHAQSLYRQELHVPLILAAPGGVPAGRRIAAPVSLRDLPMTVAGQLGLAASAPFPGRSLDRFWAPPPGPPAPEGPILSEVSIRPTPASQRRPGLAPALHGPMASVVAEGLVYIRDAFGAEELYDLARDAGELRDLSDSPEVQPALGRCRLALDRLVEGRATGR